MTLKDCCIFQEGYVNPTQKESRYFDGNIKWLRSLDLNDGFVYKTSRTLTEAGYNSAGKSAFMFPAGSLAISKSGTVGKLGILMDSMCGNRAVINIQVNSDKANLRYIFYLLKYKYSEIITMAVGSIQKNLYVSELEKINLIHNDLPAQKKIADVLSCIDDKIALNNKTNLELENMAKTVYDYWFTQFDFPDENGKPYKSSGGKMEYNEILKRVIPVGWEINNLCTIADIYNGSTPSTKENDNYGGNIIWITPKDLSDQQRKFTWYGERNITEKGYRDCNTTLIPKGAILLSSRAPIGLISIAACELCTNQGFKNIVPKNMEYKNYIYSLISANISKIEQLGSGTTFKEVSKQSMEAFKVVIPPIEIIKKFNGKIETTFENQLKILKENDELIKIRDYLLPLLMNGQIEVK